MSHLPILDAAGSLALELSGSSLIEASAGTGKTYTIANLYLRHIVAGHPPGEILVVSFTNAATDELLQRIHSRLYQAQQALENRQAPADEFLQLWLQQQLALDAEAQLQTRNRIQYALRGMDEAMISTIHGFCFSALQDHALLSNRHFEAEITTDDSEFWETALRDWWRRNSYNLSATAWQLLQQAIPDFASLAGWQQQWRNHAGDQLLPEVSESLEQLLRDSDKQDEDRIRKLRARALLEAHRSAKQQVTRHKLEQSRLAYQDQLELLLEALRGATGSELAQRLRARFPVAMIDEFQDTDRIQFEIFQRLYFARQDCSLTLIGDPKQAIYSFRGSDIFSYIQARALPDLRIYALQTNWRSQAGLVAAVNRLFSGREAPFIYQDAIGFQAAQAAAINDSAYMSFDDEPAPALTCWQLPLQANAKTMPVGRMRDMLNRAVVAEIAKLLNPAHKVHIDGHALHSGDIAVLVRSRDEGEALRASLTAAGIGSVSIGRDKVFDSAEAQGLLDLLEGIARPGDESCLRRARASSLFSLDFQALAAAIDDDHAWQDWVDSLQDLQQIWLKSGFISMFQQMLESLQLGVVLASGDRAERSLTNLSQLGELLQLQARRSPGIEALINWLQHQMNGAAGDEAELRLESDASLVKIVTVHKSKGLEYPVVFLPFMWRCRLATKSADLLRFHDDHQQAYIDLGSENFEKHGFIAEKERLAEDLRLLYVALTRARSKLYLAWGDAGDGRSKGQPKHSALAYLLHSQQSPQDLDNGLPMGFDNHQRIDADLQSLARDCAQIEVIPLPQPDTTLLAGVASTENIEVIEACRFSRDLGPAWRINSFSGLTRDVHQLAVRGEIRSQGDAILDFPAGSHVGLLLHELLEHLDFQQDIAAQCQQLMPSLAPTYGISHNEHLQTLQHWLQQIVETELDTDGMRLRDIAGHKRLNELQFDFAVEQFDVDAVNALLQSYHRQSLQPITGVRFRGLLTGIIDLVFEYRGKYYLADYKSNHLGASLTDYEPENLQRAMLDRRYDLQALLYSLALHRYLRERLPDYDYNSHFGGYYYLFLRAMRPASGPRFGVSFDCPSAARLESLERLLAPGSMATS